MSIQSEYSKKKNRRIITIAVTVALLVLLALMDYADVDKIESAAWVILSLIAGIVLYGFVDWRCPNCNTFLGRGMAPQYCSNCGVKLDS